MSTEDPRETLPRTPAPEDGSAEPAEPTAPARPAAPETTQAFAAPQPAGGWPGARATSPGEGQPRPVDPPRPPAPASPSAPGAGPAAAAAAAGSTRVQAPTTVLPGERRPERPTARPDRTAPQPARSGPRPTTRPPGRGRRARLVLQRVDPWSVFLFSLVASICLGIVLLVAVVALYAALSSLGVLSSLNTVLGEVLGGTDEVGAPFFTLGRVLGATAVLAAVDVVLLTILATLSALLYNLCASLTGGIEVVLGERD